MAEEGGDLAEDTPRRQWINFIRDRSDLRAKESVNSTWNKLCCKLCCSFSFSVRIFIISLNTSPILSLTFLSYSSK
jgi:hypothetical protein